MVSFMPRSLCSGAKGSGYPLDRKLGETQNRSGRRGEEKNTCPYRNSKSDPSAVHPIASCYTECDIPAHEVHMNNTYISVYTYQKTHCVPITEIYWLKQFRADHSGCAVQYMNCLRPFKHRNRGFESHSRHGCLRLFCLCCPV
jgi:hypothetical protein